MGGWERCWSLFHRVKEWISWIRESKQSSRVYWKKVQSSQEWEGSRLGSHWGLCPWLFIRTVSESLWDFMHGTQLGQVQTCLSYPLPKLHCHCGFLSLRLTAAVGLPEGLYLFLPNVNLFPTHFYLMTAQHWSIKGRVSHLILMVYLQNSLQGELSFPLRLPHSCSNSFLCPVSFPSLSFHTLWSQEVILKHLSAGVNIGTPLHKRHLPQHSYIIGYW